MAAGEVPYVAFVEKKPLLSFLFYAPVALTGFHPWLVQLLAMGWVFGTCLLVAQAARELHGTASAGWLGGWLACLALVGCVPAVNCETMLNLPAAAALLFFVRAERSRRLSADVLTGVALGVSALFKQQAGMLLVSLVASLAWRRASGPPRLARAFAMGAGFTAPWALCAAAYAGLGHFASFYEWNVTRNLAYQAHGAGSSPGRLALGLLIGVVLAAPVQWVLAAGETAAVVRGAVRDPVRRALVLALWLTFVPVSMGGRFYPHYFIQFAPLVALVAVPGALRLQEAWPGMARIARRLVTAGLGLPVAVFLVASYGDGLRGRLPLQDGRAREVASWIKAHSAPEERLFVWGHFTPIYVLAERLPGVRHYNASALVGDFDPHHLPEGFDLSPYVSAPDVDVVLEELDRRRPAFFVDTAPADIHEWHKVPLAAVPALERYVHAHYARVASPGGADVYRRLSDGAPR